MLQAFIITLREGVEAALIVGIVFAYLGKIGRPELKRTVFWALGSAVAASIAVAIVLAHTPYNSDIVEGWVMLAAAVFVISMIWFMHKTARTMKGQLKRRSRSTRVRVGYRRLGCSSLCFCWCCARA
jgi:high-affinity iron transporter